MGTTISVIDNDGGGRSGNTGQFWNGKKEQGPPPQDDPWILEKKIVLPCMKPAGLLSESASVKMSQQKAKLRPRVQSTSQPYFGLSQKNVLLNGDACGTPN